MIAQKLDLLMKVTNTQNSTLGRALAFDPSYIGRIRAGKRGLPKNQPFIEPAAAFFARNMREPYQRATIAQAVCPGRSWPEDAAEAEALLGAWLSHEDRADYPVERLLTSLSASPVTSEPRPTAMRQPSCDMAEYPLFYYGNSGKRNAVDAFLGELCALETPQTLLLYSDEDMSWLYEDAAFARRWAELLITLICKGGRIRIIHTISRDIGEMLEAVQKWMPLYSNGAIEPYYYPKLRDNVYKRTLFIAKGHSAVISNSVGNHTQEALNIFTDDANAVRALESEFNDYFSLCRPLMQIFNLRNSELFWNEFSKFEQNSADLIIANPVPSQFTMPKAVADSIALRTGCKWILKHQSDSSERFAWNLAQGFKVTEVLCLPSPKAAASDDIPIPMCDLFGFPALCYTADEFKQHIGNVLNLLRANEGYTVVLADQNMSDAILWAKEDTGVIMARSAPPTTVFGISEQRMTAAFNEYLQRLTQKRASKEKTMMQLAAYLEKIQTNNY